MSQFRARHRSALLAAALIAGAPLLLPAAAHAQPEASGRHVTFSGGGLLGVSCDAVPNTGSVTIAAETTLRVVNRTGHRATLLLDGAARGEIPSGSAAEVLFHRGPVSLALKPHCVIADEKSVRVQVIAVRPSPSTADPVGEPTPAAPSGAADAGGDRDRGYGGSSGGEAVLGRAPSQNGSGREPPAATGGDDAVTHGAMPVGPDPVAAPEPDAAVDASAPELVPGDLPDAGTGGTVPELAAEPMASVEPVSEDGPIGLLAIIATVCVLGVSISAIRAILAERASRASIA